jgi:hypothetical protein
MLRPRVLLAAGAFCAAALAATPGAGAHSDVPVLLELFTSEGCSSCPPADHLLETLDEKQPVPGALLVVLSEHVDYWNRLGWKDPFSSAQFSDRQQVYTSRHGLDGVYTPQLVVDGRYGFVGSDSRAAASAIQKAIREPKVPITITNAVRKGNELSARIELPPDPSLSSVKAILYVAIADSRQESHVARGENGGRTLAHVAVTRVLKEVAVIDLAAPSARDVELPLIAGSEGGLRLVAFVQDAKSGHVLGVTQQKL